MKKKKIEEYKITTLQDIADMITLENYDAFMKDFTGVVKSMVAIKVLAKGKQLNFPYIIWKDDNERVVTLDFRETKENVG